MLHDNENSKYHFDNVTQWLDACDASSEMSEDNRSSRREDYNWQDKHSWTKSRDYSHAREFATLGWKDGAEMARKVSERVRASLDNLVPQRIKHFRRQVYGGGTLLVSNYLRGEPDCYLHMKREKAKKFVRVVVNVAASAGIDANVLVRRGVVLAGIIDALELHNYRVKVDLALGLRGNKLHHETYVSLKDFSESLELDRLVFWLAHPASLRRFWFSFAETLTSRERRDIGVPGGYGMPSEVTDKGDVYLPKAHLEEAYWRNEETATKQLVELFKSKGITFDND
jgi:hypothetical protein